VLPSRFPLPILRRRRRRRCFVAPVRCCVATLPGCFCFVASGGDLRSTQGANLAFICFGAMSCFCLVRHRYVCCDRRRLLYALAISARAQCSLPQRYERAPLPCPRSLLPSLLPSQQHIPQDSYIWRRTIIIIIHAHTRLRLWPGVIYVYFAPTPTYTNFMPVHSASASEQGKGVGMRGGGRGSEGGGFAWLRARERARETRARGSHLSLFWS
jgi:hypothetical protein